jgi:hypothetical protein
VLYIGKQQNDSYDTSKEQLQLTLCINKIPMVVLYSYLDANWARDKDMKCSTSSYYILFVQVVIPNGVKNKL